MNSPDKGRLPSPGLAPLCRGSQDLGQDRPWVSLSDRPPNSSRHPVNREIAGVAAVWRREMLSLWGQLSEESRAQSVLRTKQFLSFPGAASWVRGSAGRAFFPTGTCLSSFWGWPPEGAVPWGWGGEGASLLIGDFPSSSPSEKTRSAPLGNPVNMTPKTCAGYTTPAHCHPDHGHAPLLSPQPVPSPHYAKPLCKTPQCLHFMCWSVIHFELISVTCVRSEFG